MRSNSTPRCGLRRDNPEAAPLAAVLDARIAAAVEARVDELGRPLLVHQRNV
jgi:hypothetical protein